MISGPDSTLRHRLFFNLPCMNEHHLARMEYFRLLPTDEGDVLMNLRFHSRQEHSTTTKYIIRTQHFLGISLSSCGLAFVQEMTT